jgi:hypothetical protein
MRKPFVPVLAVLFAAVLGGAAMARGGGNTATQIVSFQVSPINELAVSGNPAALNVNSAAADSQPDEVSDSSTTYSLTTNEEGRTITGRIDSAMPSGVTLKINLQAPSGGTSAGDVILGTGDSTLVTGISDLAASGKTITYKLDATVDAGVIAPASRTVTLTLLDDVS